VLVDIDKRELIAILPKRTQESSSECLKSWGIEVLSQIAEVSIDLFSSKQKSCSGMYLDQKLIGEMG
jgi:transposase